VKFNLHGGNAQLAWRERGLIQTLAELFASTVERERFLLSKNGQIERG